jgi:hypothetical protein
VLITNNESEFKRVSNLKIENWAIWIYVHSLYYIIEMCGKPIASMKSIDEKIEGLKIETLKGSTT